MEKEMYLKNINLNIIKNLNYLYNTEQCKIIYIDLNIKNPQISMSSGDSITVEGYLPTSYKYFDLYEKGEIYQQITLLKGYRNIGLLSDKYTLYLTLIKK